MKSKKKLESTTESEYWLSVTKKFSELGLSYVQEDMDLLMKYVVTRFLKVATCAVPGVTDDFIQRELFKFLDQLQPELIAFTVAVNTLPIQNMGNA